MNAAQPTPNASGAVASRVLCILGIIVCPICGPIAWSLGHRAEREVDASGGMLSGRGLATAGKVLGIVGTVWLAVIVLFVVVGILILGIALDGAFDDELRESMPV